MPEVCFHSATFVEGKGKGKRMGLLLILGGKTSEDETVTKDTIISLDTGVSFPVKPKHENVYV